MKITYTGRQVGLAPAQLKKLEARFAKIGKLLDGKRECEGHVILSVERHLNHAEVTVTYYGQQLVGLGSNSDLFTAIHSAAEKLEKQALKARTKWRDNKRVPRKEMVESEPEPAPAPVVSSKPKPKAKPKVQPEPERDQLIYHVDHHKKQKPMTLDEAVMEMDSREYLVYRDAQTDRISVLVRRKDGHFDLVES